MSLLIITTGPTHSGKTTFGKNLCTALGESTKIIQLDNDLIDEFIKKNYNNLRTDKEVLAKRTPENPDLRLLIPRLIADYALNENYNVITTAAHPYEVIRKAYYEIAAKNNAKIVLLIFRISREQAIERIQSAKRDEGILDISPHDRSTFTKLFDKQINHIVQEPSEEEKQKCFKVYEVTPSNADEILNKVSALLLEDS